MANPFIATRTYILHSIAELKKVTWPSREMTVRYSVLVAAISIATAAFFATLDFGLRTGVTNFFNRSASDVPAAEVPSATVTPELLEVNGENVAPEVIQQEGGLDLAP
ncbi:MAG: SecE/Sec61-gamma subunit of protein translocation complex [Candidatus Parcubacteria bacterium]|jgi:preprotein translocase SecE subunit